MPDDDVVEVSPTSTGSRRRLVATGALLAVLAAGVGVATWLATRGPSPTDAGDGSLTCPGQVTVPDVGTPGAAVPVPPSASGTSGRLVPDRDPGSVVVCEYAATVAVSAASEQPGTHDGDFPGGVAPEAASGPVAVGRTATPRPSDPTVAGLLTRLREATTSSGSVTCASFAGAASVDLVGLQYDDGTVWVAGAAPCAASNGAVTVGLDVTTLVAAALDADGGGVPGLGVEPAPPGSGAATSPGVGSSGGPADPGSATGATDAPTADPFAACAATDPPTAELVPFTPTGVRICHAGVDPSVAAPTVVDRPADVAAGLAAALGALPTLAPDTVCTALGGEQWALLFTAAGGTTAAVQVDAGGCGSATNGVTTVHADTALYDVLTAAQ